MVTRGKKTKKEEVEEETDPVEVEEEKPAAQEENEDSDDDAGKKDGDDEDDEAKADDEEGGGKAKGGGKKESAKSTEALNEDDFITSPHVREQMAFISKSIPKSKLEIALSDEVARKDAHVSRLTAEVIKLKKFISKRKQTYKRKRKESGAPTRALSAYNIFVKDRFKRLSKENEVALASADTDAQLKRVPPANLVAATGGEWKNLSVEEKAYYEERAKADRKRYEEQMATYQAPEKKGHNKRNKTGYNMFFSAHVNRLKQSEAGVPSERGSVARLVGNAWKELTADEKQFYEKEADRHNEINPPEKSGEGGSPPSKKSRGASKMEPNYHTQAPRAPVVHQPQGGQQHGGPPPTQDQYMGGWGYPSQGGYDPQMYPQQYSQYPPQYGQYYGQYQEGPPAGVGHSPPGHPQQGV